MKEKNILKNIRAGSKQDLEIIYVKYREEFVGWIVSKHNLSVDDAKDIYQLSILLFYENIVNKKLTKLKSSIKTYLFAVGKNKAREFNRHNNRSRQIDNNRIPTKKITTEEAEEKEKLLNVSEKSLGILGDPCKTLLEHYYFHKKSMAEICNKMGYKNENSVKNQKYKCLLRLREIFKKEVKKQKTISYG